MIIYAKTNENQVYRIELPEGMRLTLGQLIPFTNRARGFQTNAPVLRGYLDKAKKDAVFAIPNIVSFWTEMEGIEVAKVNWVREPNQEGVVWNNDPEPTFIRLEPWEMV